MKLVKFFDRLEDESRGHLSHFPILYAFIGGVTIVLFWRGVWHYADYLQSQGGLWAFLFDPLMSTLISVLILLATGLFVSFFIGDRIILSGLKHEKKIEEKTETEVREEETMIVILKRELDVIKKELEDIKTFVKK